MKLEKFNVDNGKTVITIAVVVAVIVIIFVFGRNIMDFINNLFGNDNSVSKEARDKVTAYNYQSSNPNSPFSPKVYQNRPASAQVISESQARDIITDIYSSVGFFFDIGTDATEGFQAIQKCNTQCDVSYCVTLFASSFNTDMYDFMTRHYRSSNDIIVMNQILDFVHKLPVY